MKKESLNKLNLPDFDKLDKDFEISEIESENFILRNIRKKICEKLELSIKFLEDLMQPSEMSTMIEYKELDESDGQKAFEIYKKIMVYLKKSTELYFEDDDDKNIQWINEVYTEWPKIKQELINLNKKISKCWIKPSTKKETIGYLG